MAKVMGWHWGVWAPLTLRSDTRVMDDRASYATIGDSGSFSFDEAANHIKPSFYFGPRPTSPNVFVNMDDCRELRLARQFSKGYNAAIVKYTDAFGVRHQQEVTRYDKDLNNNRREILLDAGICDEAYAEKYATDILDLTTAEARATGSSPQLWRLREARSRRVSCAQGATVCASQGSPVRTFVIYLGRLRILFASVG
jgi:hypothetical protein